MNPQRVVVEFPPLCMNCKHFIPPPQHSNLSYGKCARHARVNVVHGKIEYMYAENARRHVCAKARYFEHKDSDT